MDKDSKDTCFIRHGSFGNVANYHDVTTIFDLNTMAGCLLNNKNHGIMPGLELQRISPCNLPFIHASAWPPGRPGSAPLLKDPVHRLTINTQINI